MKTEKYNMSFTTGGLFLQESVKIAALYLEAGDWAKVRNEVMENNILQTRTISSSKRIYGEICHRLKTFHRSELELLVDGMSQEQAHLLWVAICRHYGFIRDFAVEVIREQFLSLRRDLNNEDYDAFFNAKTHWHPELEKITPATQKRLRQVLFKILREADLLAADDTINAVMLTPRLVNTVGRHAYQDLSCKGSSLHTGKLSIEQQKAAVDPMHMSDHSVKGNSRDILEAQMHLDGLVEKLHFPTQCLSRQDLPGFNGQLRAGKIFPLRSGVSILQTPSFRFVPIMP